MKKRTAGWERREYLKKMSNRQGRKKSEHPQVKAELDRTEEQLKAEFAPNLELTPPPQLDDV